MQVLMFVLLFCVALIGNVLLGEAPSNQVQFPREQRTSRTAAMLRACQAP